MKTTTKLYSLPFSDVKTFIFASLFVAGNMILPQLFHLIPNGGLIFLPIYFFTLISAYKFGLKAGLLTALCSPLINFLIFGMPAMGALPVILIKSALLATGAAIGAKHTGRVSLVAIVLAVLAYQVVGTLAEWIILKDFAIALQHFRIGIPGILLQIFGGYALLKAI